MGKCGWQCIFELFYNFKFCMLVQGVAFGCFIGGNGLVFFVVFVVQVDGVDIMGSQVVVYGFGLGFGQGEVVCFFFYIIGMAIDDNVLFWVVFQERFELVEFWDRFLFEFCGVGSKEYIVEYYRCVGFFY